MDKCIRFVPGSAGRRIQHNQELIAPVLVVNQIFPQYKTMEQFPYMLVQGIS